MGKLEWKSLCIAGIGCLEWANSRGEIRLKTTRSERSIGLTPDECRELVRKIREEGFNFGLGGVSVLGPAGDPTI